MNYKDYVQSSKQALVAYAILKDPSGKTSEKMLDFSTLDLMIQRSGLQPEQCSLINDYNGPLRSPALHFTLGDQGYVVCPRSNYLHIDGSPDKKATFSVQASDYVRMDCTTKVQATSPREAAQKTEDLCNEDEVDWSHTYDSLHSGVDIEADDIEKVDTTT